MSNSHPSKSFNKKFFHDFVELSPEHQAEILKLEGLLLDTDIEGDSIVRLYYIAGFFVEEFLDKEKLNIQFILPYKRGFRIHSFLAQPETPALGKNFLQTYPYHN